MALANPIFYSSVTHLCNKWFGDTERSIAAALLGLAMPAGGIVGLIMGPLYLKGVEVDVTPNSVIVRDFQRMVF